MLVDRRRASAGFGADFDRVAYTAALADALRAHDVDLVAMAGFGTVLARPLFDAFPGRVLNTHPACCRPSRAGTRWPTRWRPGSR